MSASRRGSSPPARPERLPGRPPRRGVRRQPGASASANAMPPPAPADAQRRDRVDEHVAEVLVALVAGERQHAVAELRHERLLDLVLRPAVVDQALDVGALLLGLGRLGRERRAACRTPGTSPRSRCRRAVVCGQSCASAAAGASRASGERRPIQALPRPTQQRLHLRRHELLVHRPAAHRGDAARRSITKVSGY